MKTKNMHLITQSDITRIVGVMAFILLIPILGNRFIDGWNWTMGDFVFATVMLSVLGLALTVAMRKLAKPTHRVVAGVTILAVFLWIWAELAVGVFTNWGS